MANIAHIMCDAVRSLLNSAALGLHLVAVLGAICGSMQGYALAQPTLNLMPATPAVAGNDRIVITDRKLYARGAYGAYIAPWGAKGLLSGRDYTQTITLPVGALPDGALFEWAWPDDGHMTPRTFNHISYGDNFNTRVPTPIPSRRVKDIAKLVGTHMLSLTGAKDDFNVLYDFFLSQDANKHPPGGRHLLEIEVMLRTPGPTRAWIDKLKPIGIYIDANKLEWRVVLDTRINAVFFVPKDWTDMLVTAVDLKAMLDWLAAVKLISGDEWFNGLAIGVEVLRGSGTMEVNQFKVDYH